MAQNVVTDQEPEGQLSTAANNEETAGNGISGQFRFSGRGKDPMRACCGQVKNIVNTAWTY
jgi:hypothetical protein